jgi:hypothetical protein
MLVNLFGAMLVSRELIPTMKARRTVKGWPESAPRSRHPQE